MLGLDGVLCYECSGKMVCFENGVIYNGVKIVVSSICIIENFKFECILGK